MFFRARKGLQLKSISLRKKSQKVVVQSALSDHRLAVSHQVLGYHLQLPLAIARSEVSRGVRRPTQQFSREMEVFASAPNARTYLLHRVIDNLL